MATKERDPFFDNAKYILMIVVVFGHLLQPFSDQTKWLHDLYFSIYAFHMPAFILILGYFSKSFGRKKGRNGRNSFKKFIIPYLFFQWIYSFYYWLIGSHEHFSFQLHIPNWSLWFLVSAFFWQLSLYFFKRVPATIGISISMLASLLAGYIPFIDRELTLQRTVVFLPFFIIGYYLEPALVKKFEQAVKKRWLVLGFFLIFGSLHLVDKVSKYVFLGSKPYDDFMNFPEWGALVRSLSLLLAVIGMLAFFSLISTKKRWYTERGQYTLNVYLLHGFVIQGLRALGVDQLPFHLLTFLGLLVMSFGLTYVLSSRWLNQWYTRAEQKIVGPAKD